MSLKSKLYSVLMAFCLAVALLVVGVWAVSSGTVNIGGTVSFVATDIYATITGKIDGATTNPTLSPLNYSASQVPSDAEKDTWCQNLNFAKTSNPPTIKWTVTIENKSERILYVSLVDNITTDLTNATKSMTYDGSTYTRGEEAIPAKTTKDFTMEIKVTDTNKGATVNYDFDFDLRDENAEEEVEEPAKDVGEYPMLSFKVTDSTNKYVSVEAGSTTPTGDITIPQSVLISGVEYTVTSIAEGDSGIRGDGGFGGYTGITSIEIPNSVTKIGLHAFYGCSGLKSIVIPDSVTYLGGYTFRGCTSLTSVVIGKGITNIDTSVFHSCWGLTSIIIPDRVTSIGTLAFFGCTGLTTITIPDSVTSIGDRAFEGCTNLTSITIPDSVTSIGVSAFYGCTSLAKVEVKATTVPTGASNMFYNCPLTTGILVPSAKVSDYQSASGWSTYSTYIKAGNF